MGQEISQQNKCYTSRRQQQQSFPHTNTTQHPNSQHQQHHQQQQQHHSDKPSSSSSYQPSFNNPYSCSHNKSNINSISTTPSPPHLIYSPKHKELVYTSSSISNSSSTDDEYYRQCQRYSLAKQSYEKTKIPKPLGSRKSLDSHSTTTTASSEYQRANFAVADDLYRDIKGRHQRKNSQSTDSGIYYSSCQCTTPPSRFSSAASVTSGGAVSAISSKSNKSIQKQKEYLDHHLYIKSYLDILEEDQRASAQYKIAKPGGIRNYTPKILSEVALSTSAPAVSNGFGKAKSGRKEDPWI